MGWAGNGAENSLPCAEGELSGLMGELSGIDGGTLGIERMPKAGACTRAAAALRGMRVTYAAIIEELERPLTGPFGSAGKWRSFTSNRIAGAGVDVRLAAARRAVAGGRSAKPIGIKGEWLPSEV